MLPKTIIKLRKLNNLRAGRKPINESVSVDGDIVDYFPQTIQNRSCLLSFISAFSCLACSAPQDDFNGGVIHGDVCAYNWCYALPAIAMRLDLYGVLLPRGIRKVKALRTLGAVNIARRQGKDVLQEIKELAQLCKLAVTRVNMENGQELCSAIIGLSRLESLSIRSEGKPGLCGCLNGEFLFPEKLQSLKLYDKLVKLPEWVQGLKNLVKLKLRSTMLSEDNDAMQVLGKLPILGSLHLLRGSIRGDKVFRFHQETFPSLMLLEIGSYVSVKFEQGAIPTLELLKLVCLGVNSETLSGLPYLSSLKEVVLKGGYHDSELAYLRAELGENPNRPVLKRV